MKNALTATTGLACALALAACSQPSDQAANNTAAADNAAAPAQTGGLETVGGEGVGHVAAPLAIVQPQTYTTGVLQVTTSSVPSDRMLPTANSAYGSNTSPQVSWSGAPATTQSYAIVMEDDFMVNGAPVLHWLAWNIPAGTTMLAEGQAAPGVQGKNISGQTGYAGPRPPQDGPPHHYHLQVFALDNMLDVPADSSRDAVLAAMQGHVVARGETTFSYFNAPVVAGNQTAPAAQ